ncbi:hypothetical protein E2C01_009968 [Portunus trituberculatus]|uniref:Uncharacterized protein n=1 Tax=Portunus trituberculatus TaxID=210409 RepID=A0A5B7D756_PORTR|nr:hypothetical protein [Portunus trituberculatus]
MTTATSTAKTRPFTSPRASPSHNLPTPRHLLARNVSRTGYNHCSDRVTDGGATPVGKGREVPRFADGPLQHFYSLLRTCDGETIGKTLLLLLQCRVRIGTTTVVLGQGVLLTKLA